MGDCDKEQSKEKLRCRCNPDCFDIKTHSACALLLLTMGKASIGDEGGENVIENWIGNFTGNKLETTQRLNFGSC